jgi:hypothetical protein
MGMKYVFNMFIPVLLMNMSLFVMLANAANIVITNKSQINKKTMTAEQRPIVIQGAMPRLFNNLTFIPSCLTQRLITLLSFIG